MRGLSRRKSARAIKRRLRELPQDDGLIPVLMIDWGRRYWGKVTPQAMHEAMAEKMAVHDARSVYERWGGNQWGEEWVLKPSLQPQFLRRMPLLKTDLNFRDWRRAARR